MSYLSMSVVGRSIGLLGLAGLSLSGCDNDNSVIMANKKPALVLGFDRSSAPIKDRETGEELVPAAITETESLDRDPWTMMFGEPLVTGLVRFDITGGLVQAGSGAPRLRKFVVPSRGLSPNATFFDSGRPAFVQLPSGVSVANFYVNFRWAGPSLASDLLVIWSNEQAQAGPGAPPAGSTSVQVKADGSSLAVPDYRLVQGGLALVYDAAGVVQASSSGVAYLDGESGEEWKLYSDSQDLRGSPTFAEINTQYDLGVPLASGVFIGTKAATITWDQFGLKGVNLSSKKYRYIIVKHTGVGSDKAYQLLQLTFFGPLP